MKKDTYLELTTKKIARQLVDLYIDGSDPKNKEKIQLMVNGVNMDVYLQMFQWDEAKYKLSSPLSDIIDAIISTVSKLDEELRTKASAFQAISNTILAEKRKKTGNLMNRDLSDHIKPEDFVDSPNLSTLFVVVPRHQTREWDRSYEDFLCDENLGGGVVPRSSTLLCEDSDHQVFSIVIFKRLVNDFKAEARKRKFTVRDFTYNPEALTSGIEEQKKQEKKRLKQKKNLIRWCRLNFAEAFIAWAHLKTVRVFVETILRYGLPADFTAVLIEPVKKSEAKLRKTLDLMYKGIGSVYITDDKEEEEEQIPGQEKFYAYVCSAIRMTLSANY